MRKTVINFKIILRMETIDFYAMFAAGFRVASTQSLVDKFNESVGHHGWSSMRSTYNVALIDELARRGIDISAVRHGKSTSFDHQIVLSGDQNKLLIADGE